MNTLVTGDFTRKSTDIVYKIWNKSLNTQDEGNTASIIKGPYVFSVVRTLAISDNEKRSQVASEWENVSGYLPGGRYGGNKSSTKAKSIDKPLFPDDIDDEAIRFSVNKTILVDLQLYYRCILETFTGIRHIKVTMARDYEIEEAEMVRFNVDVSDDSVDTLNEEMIFRKRVRKLIPLDMIPNFVLTFRIVECKEKISSL